MKAYKGFDSNITSVMGDRKKKNSEFILGETKTVKTSKTASSGFHCCEYPFDCLTYYPMNGKNRFFEVAAEGDIDEDEHGRIACTKITLVKELSQYDLAFAALQYMILHTERDRWEVNTTTVKVKKNRAELEERGIVVARGENPEVKAKVPGTIMVILKEKDDQINEGKMRICREADAGKWMRVRHGAWEVCDESKGN